MKKLFKSFSVLLGSIILLCSVVLLFSACNPKGNNKEKNYDVDNEYFRLVDFDTRVLTSVGVNGHQGGGKSYQVELTLKCFISVYEYTIQADFYSNNEIVDSLTETATKNISANTIFTVRKDVSYEVYSNIDDVKATFNGKSHEDPAKLSRPLNPITYIGLANRDTAMLVGESLELDYTLTPADTDEDVQISCGDSSVIEIIGNTITAKKIGSTYVSLKALSDKSNNKSRKINIRVIEKLDYNNFKSKYQAAIESATVSVFCKRYNKNWLGQEKNVKLVSGKGIIIKSIAYSTYFLTDKSIFDPVSQSYDYEEWYITDNQGKKYSIAGIQYHKTARIAIGSFTSSIGYRTMAISNGYAYQGDYAISLTGNPLTSRISQIGYLALTSSSSTSNVFYHTAGFTGENLGEAIFNPSGEIIGLNVMFTSTQTVSVSAIEIRQLVNAVFNGSSSSGGGPIDIF